MTASSGIGKVVLRSWQEILPMASAAVHSYKSSALRFQ